MIKFFTGRPHFARVSLLMANTPVPRRSTSAIAPNIDGSNRKLLISYLGLDSTNQSDSNNTVIFKKHHQLL
jgi:hypothetical protein